MIADKGSLFYQDEYQVQYHTDWETVGSRIDMTTISLQPYVWGEVAQGYVRNRVLYKRGVITVQRQIIQPTSEGYTILAEGSSQYIDFIQMNYPCGGGPSDRFTYHLNCEVHDEIEFSVTDGPHWTDPDEVGGSVWGDVTPVILGLEWIDIWSNAVDESTGGTVSTDVTDITDGGGGVGYCANPAQTSLLTGLKAWWALDEASGNAIDALSTNNLTDNGGVGATTGRCIRTAREFGDISKYFSHIDADDLAMKTGGVANSFTLAGWFKTTQVADDCYLVMKCGEYAGEEEYELWMTSLFSLPHVTFAVFDNSGSSLQVGQFRYTETDPNYETNNVIVPDEWTHVVCWYDATLNKIGISVNNRAVCYDSGDGFWTLPRRSASTPPFTLGSSPFFGGTMTGYMCDWGVWHRLLTDAERTALYSGSRYPFNGT